MVTWTRADLKDRAKETMRRNYWRMVLVGFIMMIVSGAFSGGSGTVMRNIQNSISRYSRASTITETRQVQGELQNTMQSIRNDMEPGEMAAAGGLIAVLFVVLLIATVVSAVLSLFLIQPVIVGGRRFFSRSLVEDAQLNEITYAFSHNYLNVVKNMFLMSLFTSLWTLLFIIPGIVKSYEYRMVPYLLGEHPEMSTKELFDASRRMMRGQKWSAFVLDVSFVLWNILGFLTCGIVFIFWVYPYVWLTNAALYHELSKIDRRYAPQESAYGQGNFSSQGSTYSQGNFGSQGSTYSQGNFGSPDSAYNQGDNGSQGNSYNQSVPNSGNSSFDKNTPYGQDYYSQGGTEHSDHGDI